MCIRDSLYTIVDAKWQDQIAEWKAIDPEIDASNCKWFYEGNTIEEACAAMAADTESGAYELDAAADVYKRQGRILQGRTRRRLPRRRYLPKTLCGLQVDYCPFQFLPFLHESVGLRGKSLWSSSPH